LANEAFWQRKELSRGNVHDAGNKEMIVQLLDCGVLSVLKYADES